MGNVTAEIGVLHRGCAEPNMDFGTKQGLRKRSMQGFVPVHKPNHSNPSPHSVPTHPIRIIEGDATGVVNVNQFTYSHSITTKTAGRVCCLKG